MSRRVATPPSRTKRWTYLGLDMRVTEDEILNDPGFVGAGYGIPSEASVEGNSLIVRAHRRVLDPRPGLHRARPPPAWSRISGRGVTPGDDTLVFVHIPGGTPAIFTWSTLWL